MQPRIPIRGSVRPSRLFNKAISRVRLGRGSNAQKSMKKLFLQKRDRRTNGQTDGLTDGPMDGPTDGPTDGHTLF